MNKENLIFLQENLRYLGFGDTMTFSGKLEQEVEKGTREFQLNTEAYFDEWCRIEATLYFRRADKNEMYFFNKYDASLQYDDFPDHNKMQTFYISKGSGVTFKEAFNLLQGRAVNRDLTSLDGEKYNAWIQLNFEERTANNNFKVRQFRMQYGYDLEKVLHNYPIRELEVGELKESLIRSLKKGNVHAVTFAKINKTEKMYIEACPQYKTITIYSHTTWAAQKPAFLKDPPAKEDSSFLSGGLEDPSGSQEEEREIEEVKEEEGSSAKKRSRRSGL